jgi:vacuolar-type H+-ATPase subunit H
VSDKASRPPAAVPKARKATAGARGPVAARSADRVAEIVAAAEAAADKLVAEAEQRARERVDEGNRAAEDRIRTAEERATEIVRAAQEEADRLRAEAEKAKTAATGEALRIVADADTAAEKITAEAEDAAAKSRAEAEGHATALIQDARAAADGVRGEGLELVAHLREMSGSLNSNAERLLRDIQQIHSRMVSELTAAPGGSGVAGAGRPEGLGEADQPAREPEPAPRSRRPPADGDDLDVPEFMARG